MRMAAAYALRDAGGQLPHRYLMFPVLPMASASHVQGMTGTHSMESRHHKASMTLQLGGTAAPSIVYCAAEQTPREHAPPCAVAADARPSPQQLLQPMFHASSACQLALTIGASLRQHSQPMS